MKYPKTLKGKKLCDFIEQQGGEAGNAYWGDERAFRELTFMPCSAKLVEAVPAAKTAAMVVFHKGVL